jgi:hypothetical protein
MCYILFTAEKKYYTANQLLLYCLFFAYPVAPTKGNEKCAEV